MGKKTFITVVILMLITAVAGVALYFVATADQREEAAEVAELKATIQDEIDAYRSGRSKQLDFFVGFGLENNSEVEAYVIQTIEELYKNQEINILCAFLDELDNNYENENVLKYLQNSVENSQEIDLNIRLLNELNQFGYYSNLGVSKKTRFLASYIENNGTKPVTLMPGQGYYANHTDESHSTTIGIAGSPLHEDKSVTYMGDFKKVVESGVRLNSYYEEESYSRTEYFFRECFLFDFNENWEFVWSGDYLFCFSANGDLETYIKVND